MSSIPLAIALGCCSATVYGVSIVVQHRAMHVGQENARGLLRSARDPRWLMAIGGDSVGFLLQIGALTAGPVVLVQPLTVLMLPVSMVAAYLMGGPRPRLGDYGGSLAVIGGLAVFLGLVGTPGAGHVPHPERIAFTVMIVLVIGTGASLSVLGSSKLLRGAVYGAAAGMFFGMLGVLVDAASDRVSRSGWYGLVSGPRGLVPLVGIAVVGLGGIVLTQVSFQVGALSATLPANLATDPLTAVVIGAIVLREHIPVGPWHLVGYAFCLAAVIAGTMRLAAPGTAAAPQAVPPPPGSLAA